MVFIEATESRHTAHKNDLHTTGVEEMLKKPRISTKGRETNHFKTNMIPNINDVSDILPSPLLHLLANYVVTQWTLPEIASETQRDIFSKQCLLLSYLQLV